MNPLLHDYLKEAIYLENRGFHQEARQFYDKLSRDLEVLDVPTLTRISMFYDVSLDTSIVYRASRLSIERGGDIKTLIPIYLEAWKLSNQEISGLMWLVNEMRTDQLIQESLIVARQFFSQGLTDKAYIMALEINERVDRLYRQNPSESELYIESVLFLVENEYSLRNYTQARFQLRKLIYLKENQLSNLNQITYWSILLDEVTSLTTRQDWSMLSTHVTGDNALITDFYMELAQGKLTMPLIDRIRNARFTDVELEKKRHTYERLIKKISKHVSWYEGIEEAWEGSTKDLLMTLLYADYLKENRPNELVDFWKVEFVNHSDRIEALRAYDTLMRTEKVVEESRSCEECSITFFGGGEKIGGTSILISVEGHHLLLDAGMHMNEETYHPDYGPLYEKGLSFEDIDALLITHAHMDHTGAVPYVYNQRTNLPMFATEPTIQLMKLLLNDAVKIGKDNGTKMYSDVDVHHTVHSIQSVEFNQTFYIPTKGREWKITYYHAGHILGAAAIHIQLGNCSILFTGDYSIDDQRTVQGLQLPDDLKVDVLITESTYGYLPTNASIDRRKQEELFVESVNQTMLNSGTMLIPAFAVGRAQEVVMILKERYKHDTYLPFNLFLDGRVTDVCHIYERFAEMNKFVHPNMYSRLNNYDSVVFGNGVQSAQDIYSNRRDSLFKFEDFIEDYIHPGNNCIVASSGMLTENSASARYAEHLISDRRNSISFTGYMDEESPGQHILHKAKTDGLEKIKIHGIEKEISAKIDSFRLSAHASREQITQLILKLQPAQVFLMHGEHQKQYRPVQAICEGSLIYPTIIDLLKWSNANIQVVPAFNGTDYTLSERG